MTTLQVIACLLNCVHSFVKKTMLDHLFCLLVMLISTTTERSGLVTFGPSREISWIIKLHVYMYITLLDYILILQPWLEIPCHNSLIGGRFKIWVLKSVDFCIIKPQLSYRSLAWVQELISFTISSSWYHCKVHVRRGYSNSGVIVMNFIMNHCIH